MKVEFKPAPEMERASLDVADDSITVEPIFWKTHQVVIAGAVTVRDESGKILSTRMLHVSGKNGRTWLAKSKKPVRPAADGKAPKSGK